MTDFCRIHLFYRFRLVSLALVALLATSIGSTAATFNISLGGQNTTFMAPMGGGVISNLSVTLGGVTFDTPNAGMPPLYSPLLNDISAAGSLFGYFSNSTAAPGCPVGNCVLEFETAFDNVTPPVFATYNNVVLGPVLTSGFYVITPAAVPLPAGLLMILTALCGLAGLRLCRQKAPATA